jgi:hypothetical protein
MVLALYVILQQVARYESAFGRIGVPPTASYSTAFGGSTEPLRVSAADAVTTACA